MTDISPFTISVPEAKVERLKQKLALTDLPEEPDDFVPWERGSPKSDIRRLLEHWKNGFDWRKAEAKLNELPHFVAPIVIEGFETLDIHFIHQQSTVKNAIPLLFVHGWPGSFIEVTKMLPMLVNGGPDMPSFHVVAPSLVDYGFSSMAPKKGFGIRQHAEAYNKLMHKLGYTEYVTQGGDIGYFVTRFLAKHYPNSVKAQHINMAVPTEPTLSDNPALFAKWQVTTLTEKEKAGLKRSEWFQKEGNAYNKEHATKPQTIGYSLADSPVGLLAWIYEKLHDWTDSYPWTDDDVLTWISIYYFSRAGPGAPQRLYYEFTHAQPSVFATCSSYIDVPLGIAHYPKELYVRPNLWHEAMGPIVLFSDRDHGGHFAAWEHPEEIVEDLRTMLRKGGPVFGCVQGKSGYEERHEPTARL